MASRGVLSSLLRSVSRRSSPTGHLLSRAVDYATSGDGAPTAPPPRVAPGTRGKIADPVCQLTGAAVVVVRFGEGLPIDRRGEIQTTNHFLPIQREGDAPPAAFVEQATEQQVLVTGIKVADLLGKIGLSCGAGAGKTVLINNVAKSHGHLSQAALRKPKVSYSIQDATKYKGAQDNGPPKDKDAHRPNRSGNSSNPKQSQAAHQ